MILGQFQVNLYLINDGGCIDSSSVSICVVADNKFYIPNSFTPDNDNCNDVFFIKALKGGLSSFNYFLTPWKKLKKDFTRKSLPRHPNIAWKTNRRVGEHVFPYFKTFFLHIPRF